MIELPPDAEWYSVQLMDHWQPRLSYHPNRREWVGEAVGPYDPSRGTSYTTYCSGATPGEVLRKLADMADRGEAVFTEPDGTPRGMPPNVLDQL